MYWCGAGGKADIHGLLDGLFLGQKPELMMRFANGIMKTETVSVDNADLYLKTLLTNPKSKSKVQVQV